MTHKTGQKYPSLYIYKLFHTQTHKLPPIPIPIPILSSSCCSPREERGEGPFHFPPPVVFFPFSRSSRTPGECKAGVSGCGRKNESELNSELHCSLAGEGMLHVTSACPSAGKGKSVCPLLRHVRRRLSLVCLSG